MVEPSDRRRTLRQTLVSVAIVVATLGGAEGIVRAVDPPALTLETNELNLLFRYDTELGWFPIANSTGTYSKSRTITAHHNSLGLRESEPRENDTRPTVLVLGDSFTWGYDVEEGERFTDLLQREFPHLRFVNAGVSGFGTDQEYLLLRKLWDRFKPERVVLVFCGDNDRGDNSTNERYNGYFKPYFVARPDREPELAGVPVPKSKRYYFSESPLARHSYLARMAVALATEVNVGKVETPDPTEALVDMIDGFVKERGGRLYVGIERVDPALQTHLKRRGIGFASLAGADAYPEFGHHWTPEGHAVVARRLRSLLAHDDPKLGPAADDADRYDYEINEVVRMLWRTDPKAPAPRRDLLAGEPALKGQVEAVGIKDRVLRIAGWAVDGRDQSESVLLLAFNGSRLLGTTRTHFVRSDIARTMGIANSRKGFVMDLDAAGFDASRPLRVFAVTDDGKARELGSQPNGR